MLGFFRKYQRLLFILTTIVVIISFSFFGTYQALFDGSPKDREAFATIDGRKVGESELAAMVRFLATEPLWDRGAGQSMNFFNDGVLIHQFIEGGLAQGLVNHFFAELQGDLQQRFQRQHFYEPYAHPQVASINATAVWSQFAPTLLERLSEVKNWTGEVTPAAFALQTELLLAERAFPPTYLHQVMRYQLQRYEGAAQLSGPQLCLFGYQNAEEWLGRPFLQVVARFIYNSAAIARERGIVVTEEEVLADLYLKARQQVAAMQRPESDLPLLMQEQLQFLGLDLSQAQRIWHEILLFRRLFEGAGNAVVADPLLYRQFEAFASAKAQVALYQMPESFRLRDYNDLRLFETYLATYSGKRQPSLDLPAKIASLEEIKANHPECVYRRYQLAIAAATLPEVAFRISLRELWDWQVDEKHWTELSSRFSEVKALTVDSKEERLVALDRLDPKSRMAIDSYSKAHMIREHPEWIAECLQLQKVEPQRISLRLKGGEFPFQGIKERKSFISLLDRAHANDSEAVEKLRCYSEDGQHYYCVSVADREEAEQLLTFSEGKSDGTWQQVLNSILKQHWPKARIDSPLLYGDAEGHPLPFERVSDRIADHYFASLLREIQFACDAKGVAWNPAFDPQLGDFCARNRFICYLDDLRAALLKDQPVALSIDGCGDPEAPWLAEHHGFDLLRSQPQHIDPNLVFATEEGAFSSLVKLQRGDLGFFQVLHLEQGGHNLEPYLLKASQTIGSEAQNHLLEMVVQRVVGSTSMSLE